MIYHMSQQSSFANTCLTHNNNRNIQSHSLGYQTHFKEVIYVDDISFFTIYFIIVISRYIVQYL